MRPIGAAFSPDGHWVAYSTRENTRPSSLLFVQPFPATGATYQISSNAEDAHHPLWSPDGKVLFFAAGPGRFVASEITATPGFAFSPATLLPARFQLDSPNVERSFDITPDGKRFVGLIDATLSGASTEPPIQVVVNWFDELRAKVPSK
jgi:Tol biopolymer transport system component